MTRRWRGIITIVSTHTIYIALEERTGWLYPEFGTYFLPKHDDLADVDCSHGD
jgi:hypothetical protein